jgi:hypothetical protein
MLSYNSSDVLNYKVLLPQTWVTVADFGYPVKALWFYCSQNFTLFGFQIFRFWEYLVKVIPETHHVHYIWYLRL